MPTWRNPPPASGITWSVSADRLLLAQHRRRGIPGDARRRASSRGRRTASGACACGRRASRRRSSCRAAPSTPSGPATRRLARSRARHDAVRRDVGTARGRAAPAQHVAGLDVAAPAREVGGEVVGRACTGRRVRWTRPRGGAAWLPGLTGSGGVASADRRARGALRVCDGPCRERHGDAAVALIQHEVLRCSRAVHAMAGRGHHVRAVQTRPPERRIAARSSRGRAPARQREALRRVRSCTRPGRC